MLEDALFVPVVVAVMAVLNLVLLILVQRLSGQVSHLTALMAARAEWVSERGAGDRTDRTELSARSEQSEVPDASGDATKWFEAFLAEDPSRRGLPKNEQFAAFRRWRSEKGMNWKSPTRSV